MSEGREPIARDERPKNPARKVGFFVSGATTRRSRVRAMGRELGFPRLAGLAGQSYRYERIHDLTGPMAFGLVEAGLIGVIADKFYGVHPTLLAVISAAPMFGNLSSVLWARLAEGKQRVPLLTVMQTSLVALVALVALLPEGRVGGWLLAADVVLARLLIGGIITLRSTVWTLNYPTAVRGRVTARLSFYTTLAITATALFAGFALDADPESFRWIYPLGALAASVGVVAFSRVRLVGEHEHLETERQALPAPRPESVDATESAAPEPAAAPGRGLIALLRDDPLFARYQLWQFLIGSANMIVEGPLILLVSRDLGASYSVSIALTLIIPLTVSMLTLPFWAVWMDRVHIAEFRAKHSGLWAASQAVVWLGALSGSLFWIGVGRTVLGAARGGGVLAWQIGHNHFATPERAARYMGVHVTLTGLRGAFAPFLGMLLYVGWSGFEVPGTGVALPAWSGIGAHMMLLAALLSVVGTLGYVSLSRRVRAEERARS